MTTEPTSVSPFHVVLIQNQFPDETHWGGISTFGWFMSRALAKEGIKVSVIAQSAHEKIEEPKRLSELITVYRIPGKKSIKGSANFILSKALPDKERWFSYNAWVTLKKWIKNGIHFDIVDSADYLGCGAYCLKDESFPTPVVVTCHTPSFLANEMNNGAHSKGMDERKKTYQLEKDVIKNADGLLSPSHRLSNLLAAITGRSLNDFFTNPYPFPIQREIQLPQKEVLVGTPFVLFTGRIERRKGISTLLDAWKQSKFAKDYTLVLTGKKTNHFPEFEKQAIGMTGTSIQFLGERSKEELAWLYRNATLVVLPSEPFDNYPYTCLESMAFGAPTLVSDSGGMSEMIVEDDNGWVFRTASVPHLCERLDEILNLPIHERQARGIAAQMSVKRINDPSRIAGRTIKFYKRVIEDWV